MGTKIKVGILGLGRAGFNMHQSELGKFPELFKIVAGADPLFNRAEEMQKRCGARPYHSLEEMLADPEVELVTIASRSADHVRHALQALEAGKYVMVEKPIAVNYQEALQYVQAEKKYPGRLFLRHNRRFEPGFAFLRELIATGNIGEVFEIKLRRLSYQLRSDWQVLEACEGGQMNNWGPHLLDQALTLLESPVTDIWCDRKHVVAAGDMEDHFRIFLRAENGRLADIQISGAVAIPEPYFTVYGTRGTLVCKNDQELSYNWVIPGTPAVSPAANAGTPAILPGEPAAGKMNTPLAMRWGTLMVEPKDKVDTWQIWKFLYQSIREGKPYPISLTQALEVVRITDEAKRLAGVQHLVQV
ncbi:MAG: Gfo/Idh/MocA family oxidoreductase [Oligosphaeraceae bacterium]|nr:Gfo/Idh/MocA family oxidoreductase [Oligosphaeraceae bacterium]